MGGRGTASKRNTTRQAQGTKRLPDNVIPLIPREVREAMRVRAAERERDIAEAKEAWRIEQEIEQGLREPPDTRITRTSESAAQEAEFRRRRREAGMETNVTRINPDIFRPKRRRLQGKKNDGGVVPIKKEER